MGNRMNWYLSKMRKTLFALLAIGFISTSLEAGDFDAERQQVLDLANLTTAPKVIAADGFAAEGNIKAIYFDGLPYEGHPTKVFAWIGLPEKTEGKAPGIVLVHGGGGTAFKDWVKHWNDHGFAAISIAVEGQTDVKTPGAKSGVIPTGWKQHAWPGPWREGIYQDSDRPLSDQWMYHAVADTILANSLLRSLGEVDPEKVGLMGISWGGIITSTVVGIDERFAFAIPTYGCGDLAVAPNQYGRALSDNQVYKQVWDPMQRIARAKMPILWYSWPGDLHFPLDRQANNYRNAPGTRMVSLVLGMRHGHGAAWNRPESYAFAESVVKTGQPWCRETDMSVEDGKCSVTFECDRPIDEAMLLSTTESGATGLRKWNQTQATLSRNGNKWQATATLPPGETGWFMNVVAGDLVVSSDYQIADSGK